MPDDLRNDLLILHPDDNVAVLKRQVTEGAEFQSPLGRIVCEQSLPMGHKIAIRPIRTGEDVMKYGAPIGIADQDIPPGAHVHLHNVSSRYTVVEDMETSRDAD